MVYNYRSYIFIQCLIVFSTLTALCQVFPQRSTFEKRQLSASFYAEGAAIGDIDRDGFKDIISGPYWYKGPDFHQKIAIYQPVSFDKTKEYSDNFVVEIADINQDGWSDIMIVGFPGDTAFWYENPKGNVHRYWKRFMIHPKVDNESPTFVDINNDSRLDLVFHTGGMLGYASYNADAPTNPWDFHAVSDKFEWDRFTHGLGAGDINGDGHVDIIKNDGWWQSPGNDTLNDNWKYHPFDFGAGGAQMNALDVNQDGYQDVVTSLDAHGYGLAWFQQIREGDDISFKKHIIMGDKPEDNPFGVLFSQLHALHIADINDDGISDLITGKRVWTRGPQEGWEPDEPAVLYYFERNVDQDTGAVYFLPFIIDSNSGVGTQLAVGDLNTDGLIDVVTANKNGTFLFLNQGQ